MAFALVAGGDAVLALFGVENVCAGGARGVAEVVVDVGVDAFLAVGRVQAGDAVGRAGLAAEAGGVGVVQNGTLSQTQPIKEIEPRRTLHTGVIILTVHTTRLTPHTVIVIRHVLLSLIRPNRAICHTTSILHIKA